MQNFSRSSIRLVPTLLLLLACQDDPEAEATDAAQSAPVDAAPQEDAAPSQTDSGSASGLDAGGSSERDAGGSVDAARDGGPSGSQPDATVREAGQSDAMVSCPTMEEERFSFFMTSYRALQRESGSQNGFGGNLGGIKGADAICQRIAEHSSACQKSKQWRAFLSTTKENAIDRIGKGPWHDRLGRLLANNLQDLAQERPRGAHMAIVNDFPNEDGVPNRNPDGTGNVDNHQTITGSGPDGKLWTQSASGGGMFGATACGPMNEMWTPEKATCWDWTSSEAQGCPRVGHSWPRQGSGLHWISVWNEGGCAPGAVLADRGGPDGSRKIGSGGGYGGFYCFAITSQ